MKRNYFHIIYVLIFLLSLGSYAQENRQPINNTIEGLSIYPNPATGGKVYISTKFNAEKEITIFDVLGKKVLQTYISSKELNISNLNPGVYIITIKERDAETTRKLIVE